MDNAITKMPKSSEFLRFILDNDEKLVHNTLQKKGKSFSYDPKEFEKGYGITPKQQIEILRVLRNEYKCLNYRRVVFNQDPLAIIDSNLDDFIRLTKDKKLKASEAVRRIKYDAIKVTVYDNCKEVFDEVFALDKVLYRVHIEDKINNRGGVTVGLFFGENLIAKMNDGSQTCKIVREIFGAKRHNGETVIISNKVGNLSDVLSRSVDGISTVKGLVYSEITKNSVKVFPEITARMLHEKDITENDMKNDITAHIKK